MGLFDKILKAVVNDVAPKAGNLLKEMIDPDSEMNRRPNLFGHTKRLDNEIKYEAKKAELERLKFERRMAEAKNESFDRYAHIMADLNALTVREKEIELELKRLPITEMELKTQLYEELAKNKENYNKLLSIKQQLDRLQ